MDNDRLGTRDLRTIHDRQYTQSAQLKDLWRGLEDVRHENQVLKEYVYGKGAGPDRDPRRDSPGDPYKDKYEKEEEGSIHDTDYDTAPDGQKRKYWGFNYFYTPEMATSKRWEDLQNVHHKDINKYFHDSKYDTSRPQPQPEEYYGNDDNPLKVNPAQTTYENTFHPQQRKGHSPVCGGFYILRYEANGHEEVSLALKNMQTIIKSYEGYVMGMASKNSIFVMEGDGGDWNFSKLDKKNPRIGFRHRLTENGLTLIWFPTCERAKGFFHNTFRNPFKETGFPTSHGFEAFFVPCITSPVFKTLDTYLLLELKNANKYKSEDLSAFEAEVREAIYNICPNSYPMVVSSLHGKETLKPGPFIKHNSKIFISRFNSQSEVAAVWNSGKIQEIKDKCNILGPMVGVSWSLKDWRDNL